MAVCYPDGPKDIHEIQRWHLEMTQDMIANDDGAGRAFCRNAEGGVQLGDFGGFTCNKIAFAWIRAGMAKLGYPIKDFTMGPTSEVNGVCRRALADLPPEVRSSNCYNDIMSKLHHIVAAELLVIEAKYLDRRTFNDPGHKVMMPEQVLPAPSFLGQGQGGNPAAKAPPKRPKRTLKDGDMPKGWNMLEDMMACLQK